MTPTRSRLLLGFLLAIVLGAAGCVVDGFAAFALTPTCQTGAAAPALLGVALLVAVAAYAVPGTVVGWNRPAAAAAGALGAAAPFGLLVWFAATPQSGFCF